jgi:hypothetical protein
VGVIYFCCNTEYDTNLPVKWIGLGRQVSFTKGKRSRSGGGSRALHPPPSLHATRPMGHLISPQNASLRHTCSHAPRLGPRPIAPTLIISLIPSQAFVLKLLRLHTVFSPTMLPRLHNAAPAADLAALHFSGGIHLLPSLPLPSFPASMALSAGRHPPPSLPPWLPPPAGMPCPLLLSRRRAHCCKDQVALLQAVSIDATIYGNRWSCRARICRRRRRSILPAAPAHATVDARRCFHQWQPMLPSTVVIAFVSGGRCCRRRRSIFTVARARATIDARRCFHRRRSMLPSTVAIASVDGGRCCHRQRHCY